MREKSAGRAQKLSGRKRGSHAMKNDDDGGAKRLPTHGEQWVASIDRKALKNDEGQLEMKLGVAYLQDSRSHIAYHHKKKGWTLARNWVDLARFVDDGVVSPAPFPLRNSEKYIEQLSDGQGEENSGQATPSAGRVPVKPASPLASLLAVGTGTLTSAAGAFGAAVAQSPVALMEAVGESLRQLTPAVRQLQEGQERLARGQTEGFGRMQEGQERLARGQAEGFGRMDDGFGRMDSGFSSSRRERRAMFDKLKEQGAMLGHVFDDLEESATERNADRQEAAAREAAAAAEREKAEAERQAAADREAAAAAERRAQAAEREKAELERRAALAREAAAAAEREMTEAERRAGLAREKAAAAEREKAEAERRAAAKWREDMDTHMRASEEALQAKVTEMRKEAATATLAEASWTCQGLEPALVPVVEALVGPPPPKTLPERVLAIGETTLTLCVAAGAAIIEPVLVALGSPPKSPAQVADSTPRKLRVQPSRSKKAVPHAPELAPATPVATPAAATPASKRGGRQRGTPATATPAATPSLTTVRGAAAVLSEAADVSRRLEALKETPRLVQTAADGGKLHLVTKELKGGRPAPMVAALLSNLDHPNDDIAYASTECISKLCEEYVDGVHELAVAALSAMLHPSQEARSTRVLTAFAGLSINIGGVRFGAKPLAKYVSSPPTLDCSLLPVLQPCLSAADLAHR